MAPTLFSLQIKINLYKNNPQSYLRGAKVADGETNKNHLKPINLPITFIIHLRGRGSIASKKPNSFNINT